MKKYNVIYADPPWSFKSKKTGGSMRSGALSKYSTMTIEDIKNLPIKDIAADDCVLVMWYVGSQPQEALDVVEAWGFKIKGMNGFTWVKETVKGNPVFGMGYYTRAGMESAIIAVKGKPKIVDHSVRQVRHAKAGRHSEKPAEFRDDIVKMCGDVPRIELFARARADGWDAFGNEIEGSEDLLCMDSGINVFSGFDGMSCGRIALDVAGIKVNKYYASEVDNPAQQASRAVYPDIIRMGDITKWREWDIDWSSIDLILAGSPCQGFSFAGKQAGTKCTLNGEDLIVTSRAMYSEMKKKGATFHSQSHLFWEYAQLLAYVKAINPNVKFLLENVKMKRELLDMISKELGVSPVFINSALVSAQSRQRYYWCNWDVEQPNDKGITWGDVREHGVNSESFYYTEKALQWLARHSIRKNKPLTIHDDKDKMQMIEASHYKKYSSQRFFGVCDLPTDDEVVAAMRGRYLVDGVRQDGKQKTAGLTKQFVEFRYDGKTNALTTVQKDNIVVPFTLPNRIPVDMFFFRYITPRECLRLQTVPEPIIDIMLNAGVSNTQLYKMAGNGWTVDVIAHILGCVYD